LPDISNPRRSFLGNMVQLAGASALGALPGPGSSSRTSSLQPVGAASFDPRQVPYYACQQDHRACKQSSFDRTGANEDDWSIASKATREIFSSDGPGMINHIWMTMGVQGTDGLKRVTLRIYWDGNDKPSVEVPVGDFFGLNLSEYFLYESLFLNCAPDKGLNCYLAMPFHRSARITVTNETDDSIPHFYSNIDYQLVPELPPDALYFHAQYRQAVPNTPVALPNAVNLDGKDNYVFVETRGRGHLLGVTLGVIQTAEGWWGEGDDMTFLDNENAPAINGTGAEDYFNGAWGFGTPYGYLYSGAPYQVDVGNIGGRSCMYRWHANNPLTFSHYMKHTIEHGTANNRADYYYSVAYWYQDKPFTDFPPLPPAAERTTEIAILK
jgi:Protein of unknown function (DUF2961)